MEQGADLEERRRDIPGGLLCGWGGAGAYSDGKRVLSPEVGGFLADIYPLDNLTSLIMEVDSIYQALGAPPEMSGGGPGNNRTSKVPRPDMQGLSSSPPACAISARIIAKKY